jgi:hypothetical protein
VGALFLALAVVAFVVAVITTKSSDRVPDILVGIITASIGGLLVVAAVRLRRGDALGARLAYVVLRFFLVCAAGNVVYCVVNGLSRNWVHLLVSLVAVAVLGPVAAAVRTRATA